jgi:glycosyltransferase involved in cell wall biosynthesis
LLVIGDGPDRARLMANAGPTVSFLGRLSDGEVEYYAARCRALIFPGEEDFGMAPLEIAAAGRPTIAYRAGGAVETIVDGVTGIFFDRQEPADLAAAITRFEGIEWSPAVLRRHAENFGIEIFQARLLAFLAKVGAPVPETAFLPFNANSRAANADLAGAPMREGIPA